MSERDHRPNQIDKMFSLEGRTALVTGASSGMGRHFVGVLSDAGANVVCGARRISRVEDAARSIVDSGGRALAVDLDICDLNSVERAFGLAEDAFGVVDILVNNAGQIVFAPFPEISDEEWNAQFDVNVTGAMRMSRQFVKRLIAAKRKGNIINVASITGQLAKQNLSLYGSTKAALIHFTKQLAIDLLPHGIRCNCISPGYFRTELVGWYFDSPEGKFEVENLPAKRVGNLEELSGPLLLLASDAGSYLNGVVLPVDYGHSLRLSMT